MSALDNKAIVRRLFTAINARQWTVIDELVDPTYVEHVAGGPEIHGPEELRQFIMQFTSAFPDMHLTIEDQIAEHEQVVTRWVLHGTHTGSLLGIAPTGKQVAVPAILISRLVGGTIVEDWEQIDQLGMLQQLGAVPRPPQE